MIDQIKQEIAGRLREAQERAARASSDLRQAELDAAFCRGQLDILARTVEAQPVITHDAPAG